MSVNVLVLPGQFRDETIVNEKDLSISRTLPREEEVRTLQVLVNVAHAVQVLKAVDLQQNNHSRFEF